MKKSHGGNRAKAGAKKLPKGECKKNVAIYLEQDHIDEWGGKKKLQADIKKFIYRELQKGKW